MAETLYLVDSNVLLRWVKPDHSDYPLIISAIDMLLRQDVVLCYAPQNVAEFWNTCTRPVDRNGYGLSPQMRTARQSFLKGSFVRCLIASLFTKNGAALDHAWRIGRTGS
jgi:hypothetical protein